MAMTVEGPDITSSQFESPQFNPIGDPTPQGDNPPLRRTILVETAKKTPYLVLIGVLYYVAKENPALSQAVLHYLSQLPDGVVNGVEQFFQHLGPGPATPIPQA